MKQKFGFIKRKRRVIIAVNFKLKQLEGRNLKNIRASTGFIKQASSFQLPKLEIYCDDHSSLSSTTAVQYNNRVYVRGHKYVLGPSQTHFKMSLSRAQNIFMPKNINSITINITLEGTERIKTEKNDNKTL